MTLRIAKDTRAPSLTYTLTVDGLPFDLTGSSVKFRMSLVGSTVLKVDADAVIVNPPGTDGQLRYDWAAVDLDTAADFEGWFRVTLPGSKVMESPEFAIEVFAHGAPRTTMGSLVARLRMLIADHADPDQVFSDEDLQDFLDRRRIDVRRLELYAPPALAAGATQYLDFFDPYFGGNWEDDETLHGATLAPVTPTTADRLTGHWTFAASQLPPVYIVGKTYDVNGAAADACEVWAAREKLAFDVSADDARLLRSEKHAMLLTQAQTFRKRARMPLPAGRLARAAQW